MSRPIVVGQLMRSAGRGGMENLVLQATDRGSASIRYSVAVLNLQYDEMVEEFESAGIVIVDLGFPSVGFPLRLRRWMSSLDVVHAHAPLSASFSRVAGLTLGKKRPPSVYTEHNEIDCYSLPTRWFHLLTARLDDKVYAVSNPVRESLPPSLRRRSKTLIHGIRTERFGVVRPEVTADLRASLGIDRDAFVVLCVANFRVEKQLESIVEAVARLSCRGRPIEVLHVGHGPLEKEIRSLAVARGASIRFLGERRDIPELMAAADVFTLSSRTEGMPVTLMEAFASGLPFVGFAAGGISDAVVHGVNGLIATPASPEVLADLWECLASDRELLDGLRRSARMSAGDFSLDKSVAVLEDTYRLLADR